MYRKCWKCTAYANRSGIQPECTEMKFVLSEREPCFFICSHEKQSAYAVLFRNLEYANSAFSPCFFLILMARIGLKFENSAVTPVFAVLHTKT